MIEICKTHFTNTTYNLIFVTFQQQSQTQTQFSEHERESLIGHLVGLDTGKLVLTPRQKQALEEDTRIRQQQSFGTRTQGPSGEHHFLLLSII